MSDRLRELVTLALAPEFEIEAEIGRGATGVVYRALDRKLQRTVALKVLPPESSYREEVRRRFLMEAQTAARLVHPHIVPIFAAGETGGVAWFSMAYVKGESLARRLARESRLSFAEVRRIMQEVADALAHAHSHGVVHRDIKPDNILLEASTGRALVTDFGIARALQGDSRLTQPGVAIGSPAYMSPEQATGECAVDGRTDIYSLGVVGYQLLTGVLPFQANSAPAVLLKHVTEQPPPITKLRPDVPPGLVAIVERALAKAPSERWPNAAALRDALAAVSLARATVPEPSEPPRPEQQRPQGLQPPERRSRRHSLPEWMPPEWRAARQGPFEREERSEGTMRGATTAIHSVREFRARLATTALTIGMLAVVNVVFTPEFPWVVFPALGMGIGLARRAAHLWAAGLGWRDIFGRGWRDRSREAVGVATSSASPPDPLLRSVPVEVLEGRYGSVLKRAVSDRTAALRAVEQLSPSERELVPDVGPTVDALARRIVGLALELHRLDEAVESHTLAELDRRLESVREEPESKERERRLALLERQRETLGELHRQRQRLEEQLESAALLLQNMRLDLLALRSVGFQSILEGVASATQEARALSRDIQIALETARELRE
jgi:serine/threonine-protein kinase